MFQNKRQEFLFTLVTSGLMIDLPVIWLQTVALNFIMAYPLQIFIVGSFCRTTMSALFRARNRS